MEFDARPKKVSVRAIEIQGAPNEALDFYRLYIGNHLAMEHWQYGGKEFSQNVRRERAP
jgi:hypothetical protein